MTYCVSAPCFGVIVSGLSKSSAYRFARKWEEDNGWGHGVASVEKE